MLAFNQIWITLGPIVVINTILISSFFAYHLWLHKAKEREFAGAKRGGSKLVGSVTRDWWFWTTNPIVKLFVRLRMGPNVLTATGFLFSVVAAVLFALGLFGYAGWMMIFGASFDFFDGRVARITGKSSRSGAFFDAVMDRFGEGACMLGLAYYFRDSFMFVVVIVALVGSLVVSYTKARAEGMGVQCNVGTMQRPERIVCVGVAAILDPMANILLGRFFNNPPPILLILALILVAVLTLGTAIYRMVYVMNALDTADNRGKNSIPRFIAQFSTAEGREKFWDRARFGYDRSRALSPHVILFLMGGVPTELFWALLTRGELKNIERYLIEGGSKAGAVSAFPSAAGPASAPFVTGLFPGTCDIPGVRWFDRRVPAERFLTINRFRDYERWGAYAMDMDLSPSARTIFEYSRQAVNIFGLLNRGCGPIRDPAFLRLTNLFYRARTAGDVDAAEEAAFGWFLSAIRRDADFILYSFPGAVTGNEPTERDIKRIDSYIGRAVEKLKDYGMYKGALLMLSAVHGVSRISASFDIAEFLSRRWKVCSTGQELGRWSDSEIIVLSSGTSMAHIYIRNGEDWSGQSFFEDAEHMGLTGLLLEQGGVNFIAGRSADGTVIVQSRRGKARILENAEGQITYKIEAADPFGFGALSETMGYASELKFTANTNYPDGILQILQIFRSDRTGDIVIGSNEDTALASKSGPVPAAGHGSILRSHTLVPFISNLPIGADTIRTADIFAILTNRLGIETAHRMDGRPQNILPTA